MPTVIKAIFDNPDSADTALATLKRNNVNILAYKGTPPEPDINSGWRIPAGFPGVAAPIMTNAVPMGTVAASVMPMGFIYDHELSGGDSLTPDAVSKEVVISITVDDAQAEIAEASLISMGGRQVKRGA
jgi:hypothetical protein